MRLVLLYSAAPHLQFSILQLNEQKIVLFFGSVLITHSLLAIYLLA